MKKFFYVMTAAVVAAVGCARVNDGASVEGEKPVQNGVLSVNLKYDSAVSKSLSDYDFVLSEEIVVNGVEVMVFDQASGRLERSLSMDSVDQECVFELPVGTKIVYALVNGPDVTQVRNLTQFLAVTDNLAERDYLQEGFAMIGSEACEVVQGVVAEPEISVGRMVSRVVLRSVKCNIAHQYDGMTVDCVFLGNANTQINLAGDSAGKVNIDGYQDQLKELPIGLNGVAGDCSDYLFRTMGCELSVGQTYSQPHCLYCQPNETQNYTSLYMLVTIDGEKYYYRVPLDKGLASNVTCAVDVVITNLGSQLPPDGQIQKGEIVATVTIEGWSMGHLYNAEF